MIAPKWKTQAALGLLLLGVLGVSGCSGEPRSSQAPEIPKGIIRHESAPAPMVEGEKVKEKQALAAGQYENPKQMYQLTCAQCHDTGVGPELFGRSLAVDYITYMVRNGRAGMPAFFPSDYSDSDVQQLAMWISKEPKPASTEGGVQ